MDGATGRLIAWLDEAFERRAWHGPNFLGALRGVGAAEAGWRPGPGRHCIAEIALHCAYWKDRVLHRLDPAAGSAFPYPGRDWPRLPTPLDDEAWRGVVRTLRDAHAALRAAVAAFPADALDLPPASGGPRPAVEQIQGIAAHDIYHAGQIRLLRRLAENRREVTA